MAKHCQFNVAPVPPVKPKPGSKPGRQTDQRISSKPTINAIAQPVSSSTPVQSKPKSAQPPGGSVKKLICLLCKGDHRLGQCESFIVKSLDQRMVVVKDNGCCLRCLSRGHMSKECTSRINAAQTIMARRIIHSCTTLQASPRLPPVNQNPN